jgi:hypothetical protein
LCLESVAQTIAIAIHDRRIVGRIVGIAFARIDLTILVEVFRPIRNTTIVGIRIERIGRRRAHVRVRNALIRIRVRRSIRAIEAHFGAVEKAIIVAIGIERIDEPIPIAILTWSDFGSIDNTVVVAIGIVRVGAILLLEHVGKAVAIAIEAAVIDGAVTIVVHAVADFHARRYTRTRIRYEIARGCGRRHCVSIKHSTHAFGSAPILQ